MKKILFLLLLSVATYGQTYQNPTFGTVKTKTAPTVTTTPHLGTVETDGTISKITPENLPVSVATQDSIDTKIASNAGLQNAYNFEPEIVTSAIKGAVAIRRGSAADTDTVLAVQNGSGTVTYSVKGNGEIYTGATPTATAFTHYFGETASDGVIRPKTLADTKTEIVTLASVNAGLGYTAANNATVLHRTGGLNESVDGVKTFTDEIQVPSILFSGTGAIYDTGTFNTTISATTGTDYRSILFPDKTGTIALTSELNVLIADASTATSSNAGKLRYRVSGNNSYIDIVMQTGASTYEWVNIVQNNW